MREYYRYENSRYEILNTPSDKVFLKDKKKEKYSMSNKVSFHNLKLEDISRTVEEESLLKIIIIMVIVFFINLIIIIDDISSLSTPIENLTNYSILLTIISLIQVFIHEVSHILALRIYGRTYEKFGMKMNYFFPAFYVRMNEAYMLMRNQQLLVHGLGILVNVLLNTIIYIISIKLKYFEILLIAKTFSVSILMNMVPVLNSDGYKILITLLDKNDIKATKSRFFKWFKAINLVVCLSYAVYNICIYI